MNTTKTLQSETNHPSKRRGYRYGLGCLTLVLGLPLLVYYGFCWGLWGRESLLLQYLFQCNCPLASEEARYPKSVDVIVSACRHVTTKLSPSGRFLFVHEKASGLTSIYLLDLQTSEKVPFLLPEESGFYFLTDNLLYVSLAYEENYVLDRTTGDQYPIQKFSSLSPNAYVRGYANLSLLAEALQPAKYVFFRDYNDTIVALDPDFPASAEKNFVIDGLDIPGKNPNRTEQFLKESHIFYQTIRPDFPEEVISPDGRFTARADGIYFVQTRQKIVEGVSSSARGWTNDSRGVIYSRFLDPCLIETNFFIFDDYSCYFKVPQPVLELNVPEEHLLP